MRAVNQQGRRRVRLVKAVLTTLITGTLLREKRNYSPAGRLMPGGRTMDSIVREVVTRSTPGPRVPESPTQAIGVGAEDAELERILASLRTNIKIVGIGGGGCNTIDRLVESGIV